jgi:hypothetical protein
MNTNTDLANRALGHIGEMRISDIDDAESKAARTCKGCIQAVIDEVLREHRWNCAIKRVALSALLSPAAAQRFSHFMDAARSYFGITFGRTAAINKAERDGKFDREGADAFIGKLFGLDGQSNAEASARDPNTANEAAFSIGKDKNSNYDSTDERRKSQIPPNDSRDTRADPQERATPRRGKEGVRDILSRAKAAGIARLGRAGAEFEPVILGKEGVLKLPGRAGLLAYGRGGEIVRSVGIETARQKAMLIEALGGFPTEVIENDDGSFAVFQDYGEEITKEEYERALVPVINRRPNAWDTWDIELDGKTYRIGDLHWGNFRKDKNGDIRITDLIGGEIAPPPKSTEAGGAALSEQDAPAKQDGRDAAAQALREILDVSPAAFSHRGVKPLPFAENVAKAIAGKLPANAILDFGSPSPVLLQAGVPDLPMLIRLGTIGRKRKAHPELTREVLEALPKAMETRIEKQFAEDLPQATSSF